jgi:hypothetical protein
LLRLFFKRTVPDLNRQQVGDVIPHGLRKETVSMRNYIHRSRFRASAASAILSLLPMLVLVISTVVMVRPTLAENGAIQTAPPSQSGSEYWTKQRMRSAKPLTPTVPGTPQGGSAISGPSGPAGGAPGQRPQIQPNPGNR